jgi:hypothetical protein
MPFYLFVCLSVYLFVFVFSYICVNVCVCSVQFVSCSSEVCMQCTGVGM